MKFFVAFVVVITLIGLGMEMTKDTQGVPGRPQANTLMIIISIVISGWGLWLLLT